jgi:hypothetical protein
MKKLIAFAVVFTLFTGIAFAQMAGGISMQAWGRGHFMPIGVEFAPYADGKAVKDDKGKELKPDLYTGSGVTWGGSKTRVDFRIQGNSEFAGFKIGATAESDQLTGGDDGAYIWVKPFMNDLVKLTVGTFTDDTLRGKVAWGYDGFEKFVLNSHALDEDMIFYRLGGGDKSWENAVYAAADNGWMISSQPIDGLFVALLVNASGSVGGQLAYEPYTYMQAAVGYNIPELGHFRLQWVGGAVGKQLEYKNQPNSFGSEEYVWDKTKPGMIDFAFALSALEGLKLDLGLRIFMPTETNAKAGDPEAPQPVFKTWKGLRVALGATFNMDAFAVNAFVAAGSGDGVSNGLGAYDRGDGDSKSTAAPHFQIGLTPSYALDFATVGASFGFDITGAAVGGDGKDVKDGQSFVFGGGLFITKGVGNGLCRAGVAYESAPFTGEKGKANGSGVLRVPVIISYAFF